MADNWQPFPLPDGSYSDPTRPWSHQDLVNYLPVRAEMPGSVSAVNRRTAPGLKLHARLGAGPIRGARDVEGRKFFVSGTTFYEVRPDGTPIELGTVPGTGPVQMTHNQVAGGNQIVIVNGSAGYLYDTRDDSLIYPSTPDDGGSDDPVAPGGGTPSDSPGPGGGFPDDGEPEFDLPSVFGSNIIPNGDFADPADLDDWDNRIGDPLTGWSVAAGKAHYNGIVDSLTSALYFPARYRMSPWPFPRYSVLVEADVSCDATAKVAVGMYVGFSTGGDWPSALYSSTPTTYASSTPISYTFEYKPQDVQATALGEYVIPNFTPVMYVFDESGIAVTADFDNFSVTVTEVVPACTDAGLSNLDFASGLTGWKVLPESNQSPTLSVSGGEVTMTPIAVAGEHRWLIHETPMTAAAYDHYVHIQAEVWSNDPTSHSGVPQNGVALGLIIRSPDGQYITPPKLGLNERGDWTAREAWFRQWMADSYLADGYTVHLCIEMKAAFGYLAKLRALSVEITDATVT